VISGSGSYAAGRFEREDAMTMLAAWMLAMGAGQEAAKSPQETALAKLAAELPALIKAADADGNGTLNAVEFRAFAPALQKAGDAALNAADPSIAQKQAAKDLKKYDKNADGKLDEEERKVQAEEARLKSIKDFDWDRDGKLDEQEKTALGWHAERRSLYTFRSKVDLDGSGEATAAELGAALSSLSGIKVKKPAAP
jgi:Ca2+-binding EF-hand superfamily protein